MIFTRYILPGFARISLLRQRASRRLQDLCMYRISHWRRMQPRSRLIPGESLDNRRRVIAFALEPTIYDQSRQCQVYASTFTGWLMRPDLHCGNNIQRLVFSTDARSFRFTWHLTSRLIDRCLLILSRFLRDIKFLQKNCQLENMIDLYYLLCNNWPP